MIFPDNSSCYDAWSVYCKNNHGYYLTHINLDIFDFVLLGFMHGQGKIFSKEIKSPHP